MELVDVEPQISLQMLKCHSTQPVKVKSKWIYRTGKSPQPGNALLLFSKVRSLIWQTHIFFAVDENGSSNWMPNEIQSAPIPVRVFHVFFFFFWRYCVQVGLCIDREGTTSHSCRSSHSFPSFVVSKIFLHRYKYKIYKKKQNWILPWSPCNCACKRIPRFSM